MVRLTPPEVAVTVRVNVPASVPVVPPPPTGDPPLPQEVHSTTNSNGTARLRQARRLTAVAKLASIAKLNSHRSHGSPDSGSGRGNNIDRPVVRTVTVTIASVVPSSVSEDGETEHVDAVGAPLQLSDTAPEKPSGEIVRS